MKKIAKYIFFILIITIMVASFTSCNHNTNNEENLDVEKSLISALDNFANNNYVKVSGSFDINQVSHTNYSGIYDNNMHKAEFNIDETSYYYFSNIRFIKQDDNIIVKDYISYENMQKQLLTTLLNFYYDSDNIRNLSKINNIYMFEFIGIGTKYSFHSDYDLIGGNMNIFVDDNNNITKTIISSKYVIGKTEYNYLSITNYEILDEFSVTIPQIYPTSDSLYAQYIIERLSDNYETQSLIEEVAEFDTQTELADIPNAQSTIKSVVAQLNENIITLTVDYEKPQIIVGIDTSTSKLEFRYTTDYEFLSLKVNDSKRFVITN